MTFRPPATGNSAATLGDDRLMHFSGSLDNVNGHRRRRPRERPDRTAPESAWPPLQAHTACRNGMEEAPSLTLPGRLWSRRK